MPCRADSLLLGVLGAIVLRDRLWRGWLLSNRRVVMQSFAIFVLGAAYLGWRAPSQHDILMATIGFTWLALTYLSLILCALLYRDSWISQCLCWGWLRGMGIIAYGTYLFHEFFLGMSFGRIPWIRSWQDVRLSVIVLVVTIVFCRLSWVYFEKPLVKIGHRKNYEFSAEVLTRMATATTAVDTRAKRKITTRENQKSRLH